MGVIDFTFTNGNITVNSFSQDSYLNTPGGTFAHDVSNVSGMGGFIDSAGNMDFDPTGRLAIAQFFADILGLQPWNIDSASNVGTVTGLYELWTTGTSTNKAPGSIDVINDTLTGAVLQDAGPGAWTGTLVSAGNVGTAWGFFYGTPYTEVYNVTITEIGPPEPGVTVNIAVQGGNVQECTGNSSADVSVHALPSLVGGAELDSISWIVDGDYAGSGLSITENLSLGAHLIEATATTTTGQSDTKSVTVEVKDTIRPVISLAFLDKKGNEVESASPGKYVISIKITDSCDPDPQITYSSATKSTLVSDGDVLFVNGSADNLKLPITAVRVDTSGKDASGNFAFSISKTLALQ